MDQYKYYKSDFRLMVNIDTKYKGPEDQIVPLTSADEFVFRFYTTQPENPYICSSTGGTNPTLRNCCILGEQKVMCNFDRSQLELAPGRLMVEVEFIIPDRDFEEDHENNVKRLYTTNLILTSAADKDGEGDHTDIELLLDCLRADITPETQRATAAEQQLAQSILVETQRATGAEQQLAADIDDEEQRARDAEEGLRDNAQELVRAERQRAQGVESTLSSNITSETSRAQSVENSIQSEVSGIKEKIPSQASASNQLADKNFVNSSIATATAEFKGTYNSLAELQQVTGNENDYGYVITVDATGNTAYNRYKWVDGTGWVFEYQLNNSSFTAAEWAAIQSNITAALVTKLDNMPDDITVVDGAVCMTFDE